MSDRLSAALKWCHDRDLPQFRRIDRETKIRAYMQNFLQRAARSQGVRVKSFKHNIGCTPSEFREHIESRFTAGTTWGNYGL